MGVIYCYTNKVNGKTYIGQTTNEGVRKTQHLRRAVNSNSQYTFHKAIRKYGWDNFEYNVLEVTDDLDEREIYWIKQFDSYNRGYNMTLGGKSPMRGRKHSNEWKESMSERNKGNNNPFFGKKQSDEARDKMSMNNTRTIAVNQYTKDNVFVATFRSLEEAGKAVNGDPTNISRVCKKHPKYKSAYGFVWEYK